MRRAILALLLLGGVRASAAETADPAGLLSLLAPRPGAVVAVGGPGSLPMIAPLARAVGASGHVFVFESDPAVVASLRSHVEAEKLQNTSVIQAAGVVRLPRKADLILFHNAYHHLTGRTHYFATVRSELARNGVVAVVDYYRRPMKIGPPWRERVSSSRVMAEMREAGYRLVDRHNRYSAQYVLTFRVRR